MSLSLKLLYYFIFLFTKLVLEYELVFFCLNGKTFIQYYEN